MNKWKLSDLYDSNNDPKLISDLKLLSSKVQNFTDNYKEKLSQLDSNGIAISISEYEDIVSIAGKITSYSFLNYATNLQDENIIKFHQTISETINETLSSIVFFSNEIAKLDNEIFEQHDNKKLTQYEPWYRQVRSYKDYYLSDELEKFIVEQNSAHSNWVKLFDQTLANIKILSPEIESDYINLEQALNYLQNKNPKYREDIAKKISNEFEKHKLVFSSTYNSIIKNKEVINKWRKLPSAQSNQHISNEIETKTVNSLVETVKENYADLSHKYYKIKAKMLGMDKLNFWDRNAPLPSDKSELISYDDAKKIVLDSYNQFSPFMANIANLFFENSWIDSEMYSGKMGGGFAHPTVTSAHPYILVNYQGTKRDVMTLAHEIGHGIHQYLSASQGELVSGTQLVLSETASIFGEMLTFQNLLSNARNKEEEIILLSSKIEDKINTVVRQIAFYEFECKAHEARKIQELSFNDICNIWIEVQSESLGNAIELNDDYRNYWCYVSHFIHSPFYVYSYAFSDCIVNSIYNIYQQSENKEKFVEQYTEILSNGCKLKPYEVVRKFGLDLNSKTFWELGIKPIKEMINKLEEII